MAFGSVKRLIVFTGVNRIYLGLKKTHCEKKNSLLRWWGFTIGQGTRIVGPVDIDGELEAGEDVFIGKHLSIWGNGKVTIGERCDIAPGVTFLTGTHQIGDSTRRAGAGMTLDTVVGSGTWIGANSTILPGISIGKGCVIGAGAVVTKDVPDHVLVAGVPAKIIRKLE